MRIRRSETQRHGKVRKAKPKLHYPEYPQSYGTYRHQSELEDRSHSSEPEDGFVRLVSLRLEPDLEQPYASIGASTQQSYAKMPNALFVRYHNFLGGLDFLILRNLFDESIRTSWSKGDVFIFPTDTMCFRGRVYEDYGFDVDSKPSTSFTLPVRSDPWLRVKVMYLEDFETGRMEYEEKTEQQKRQEEKYVDLLSPWDMHPWFSRLPISGTFSLVFFISIGKAKRFTNFHHHGEKFIHIGRQSSLRGGGGRVCMFQKVGDIEDPHIIFLLRTPFSCD